MRSLFIICFAISLGLSAYCQTEHSQDIIENIDSLESVIYRTSVTIETTPKLVEVCKKLELLYSELSFPQQIEYASNIQVITDKFNNKTITISLLSIVANAYFETNDYENSIEVYYKIFNLNSIAGDEVKTAQALMKIGLNYYMLNKYMKAKDYFERALEIFKRNQYFTGIAEALQSIALQLSHWGEYEDALKFNYEAINFWREIDNIFQIATVNYNIGIIYMELGDLTRSKECFEKSLSLFEEINSTEELINSTARIGDIHLQNNEYDEALEYYLKADMIGQQINDKSIEAETSFNLGKAYNFNGDYFKAVDYLRKSIRLNEVQGNIKALSENYAELGLVYNNIDRLDQALFYLKKGLEISLSLNYKYQSTIYYKYLMEVYSKLGNFEDAFSCYKLYIEGRDQINTEEGKLKSAEILVKYQVSLKEKENERLRQNEQLINAQLKNQYLVIALVALALIVLLIMLTIFNKRYKINRRLNVQLCLKNKEIENHQKKVESLNADLQAANSAKDRFFSIIAHDLKNPFNSLMGFIELLIEDYHTFSDDERQEFLSQMKFSSNRIYALLQNLLLWGSNQMGKTEVIIEKVDLSKIAEDTISLVSSNADKKNITIFKDIPKGVAVFGDKNMISTVLLNLITNAIKFTPKDGTVEIHTYMKDDVVQVMVADTGVGISQENLEKLFRIDENVQSEGTNSEKGTGLGLILCKEFVEKNNGKIWAESIEGDGSWFYFTIPAILVNTKQQNSLVLA